MTDSQFWWARLPHSDKLEVVELRAGAVWACGDDWPVSSASVELIAQVEPLHEEQRPLTTNSADSAKGVIGNGG